MPCPGSPGRYSSAPPAKFLTFRSVRFFSGKNHVFFSFQRGFHSSSGVRMAITPLGGQVMGEMHVRFWISVARLLLVVVSLAGCAAGPIAPAPMGDALSLTSRESVTQITPAPRSDSVILSPGEAIWVSAALRNTTRYLCSSGRPLTCDRFNRKLFCICEGGRDRKYQDPLNGFGEPMPLRVDLTALASAIWTSPSADNGREGYSIFRPLGRYQLVRTQLLHHSRTA